MTRTTQQLLRYAQARGFTLTPGSKHWHATHPSGGRAIVPFGRRMSVSTERRVMADLRRAARQQEVG